MGNHRVTIQNVRVMKIDPKANLLILEGAVPGPEERLVIVHKSVKKPSVIAAAKGIQLVEIEEEENQSKKTAKKK